MSIIEEHKNENGQYHKEDGPAIAKDIGKGIDYEWYKNNVKHRLDGPAVESPNYIQYWVDGKLHRDGGYSTIYLEGDETGKGKNQMLWHLHGVSVPQHIAEAKEEDFDRKWFLEETNAEIRREIIRKFGIERIFKLVKKEKEKLQIGEAIVIDIEGDYELWEGRLTNETYGTYLKMKNPSIGVFHLEGVDPKCRTISDAIRWRNGGLTNRPEILS